MRAAQPSAAAHTPISLGREAATGLHSLHDWNWGRDVVVSRREQILVLGCAEERIVSVGYQNYSAAPHSHQYHRPQLKLFQFFI